MYGNQLQENRGVNLDLAVTFSVEKDMTAGRLREVIDKMKPREIALSLPKFKLLIRYKLEHEDILPAMGMRKAFKVREADFSGMSSEPFFTPRSFTRRW